MGIEWEETVETKRRVALVVDLKPSEPFDAPDEVRAATIDDLRRACEAVGWYQFHDWEAVHAICDEHGVSHETMNLNAQMMRPALARERVRELVVKLSEKEERYYQDALTAEAERNACLDALSEHVSPDATADTPRMVRPSSVLAGIRSLQGRLRDARSDLREHDAALEAAEARRSSEVTGLGEQLAEVVAQRDDLRARLERAEAATAEALTILNAMPGDDIASAARHMMDVRMRQSVGREALRYGLATIIDEAFGAQPVMTHEELLSFLESGLRERTRDLAAARARIAELEAPLPEATVEELHIIGHYAQCAAANASPTEAVRAGIRAVAERVRRERCLIARAVAAGVGFEFWVRGNGDCYVRQVGTDNGVYVPAAEVPATLARMLTEVGA